MAKRPEISKTQAVHDYLSTHPEAMSGEIAAALTKQGFEIKPGYVSNIKTKLNKTRKTKKKAKKQAAPAEAAPAIVEKPAKAGDTFTLEQVQKVAQAIGRIGGQHRVSELLEVIWELGGVKKFKDLAEAMATAQ